VLSKWSAGAGLDHTMDFVVRSYTGKGSKELFSLLEERKADVEKSMRSIKGFESYTLARSGDGKGGLSITVCQDSEGTDESGRVAREWISANAGDLKVDPPQVSKGSIIFHTTKH
jgi:hypothetical protein